VANVAYHWCLVLDFLWTVLGPPLIAGIVFALGAGPLRRRVGPWALALLTLLLMATGVAVVRLASFPAGAFAIPAIPACLSAALVLEWQVRRHARPATQAAWTAAAFTLVGTAVLLALLPKLFIVG